jgi:hypothetical protein
VSGLNQAERAVSAVVRERLAELRAVHEKVRTVGASTGVRFLVPRCARRPLRISG